MWVETGPLKLAEGRVALGKKQVLRRGPQSVSILLPRAPSGNQGGRAPLLPPTTVATPTPGGTKLGEPRQGSSAPMAGTVLLTR